MPASIGDFLILRALYASDGRAVAAPEEAIAKEVKEIGATEGILMAPEGAATVLALRKLMDERLVDPGDRVVLFNTGTGLKYLDSL